MAKEARDLAAGTRRPGAGAQLAERSPSSPSNKTGGAGGGGSKGGGDGLLSERELQTIEREHEGGLSAPEIVDLFQRRGIRFSEATFRKYVQQGLLPRSRRVGRKGKHQGSMGLYPTETVRRINDIKRRMAENYTIEDIRGLLRHRDELEGVGRGVTTLLDGFDEELKRPHFDGQARKTLKKDVGDARKAAAELIEALESIERRISAPKEGPSGGGAPEGAEDLL
jgi:DNA-binding transcriptional MerR regulator